MAVTRAAIAEVTFYNPRPPIGNTPEQPIWRRDHRKMCVIDDRVAFFGGMNMTRKYLATEDEGGMRVSACSSTRASRRLSSCTDTPPQATFVTHNVVSKVRPPSTLHELGINAWPTRTMNAGTRVLAAIQQQQQRIASTACSWLTLSRSGLVQRLPTQRLDLWRRALEREQFGRSSDTRTNSGARIHAGTDQWLEQPPGRTAPLHQQCLQATLDHQSLLYAAREHNRTHCVSKR